MRRESAGQRLISQSPLVGWSSLLGEPAEVFLLGALFGRWVFL